MNFLGALSQIGRMLPGYIEGERAANKDNWNDLTQFNQNLNAEMSNALNMLTFQDQAQNVRNQSAMLDDQSAQSYMNLLKNYVGLGNGLASVAGITPEQTIALQQALYGQQLANVGNNSAIYNMIQNALQGRLNPVQQGAPTTPTPAPQQNNPFNIYQQP